MGNELKMVIGMSLAYITSFAGLILAWVSWRKHHGKGKTQ
jgi:hypothetical protein